MVMDQIILGGVLLLPDRIPLGTVINLDILTATNNCGLRQRDGQR
jgi:hypothetical protein